LKSGSQVLPNKQTIFGIRTIEKAGSEDMRLAKKTELAFIVNSLLLKILSISFPFVHTASLLADFAVFLFFIYELPLFFNWFYRTKVFTETRTFRTIMWLGFCSTFLLFSFVGSKVFLPVFFEIGEIPLNDLEGIFSSIFFGLFFAIMTIALIFAFSIRKSPELVVTISRRRHTEEDLNLTLFELNNNRVSRILCIYETGTMLSIVVAFLFALWILMWALDVVFVTVILIWLVNDLLSLKNLNLFDRMTRGISSSDDAIDFSLGWKGFIRPILGGVKAISISLITIFCYLLYASFIVALIPSPSDLFTIMVVPCFWYLLTLIFVLTLRMNREFYLLRHRSGKVPVMFLPPLADIIIVLVLLITGIVILLGYFPAYATSWGSKLFLILSIVTNILACTSIAWFLAKKRQMRDSVKYRSLVQDRIRMIAILIPVTLLYSTLGEAPIILGIVSIAVVVQVYNVDLAQYIDNLPPGAYAIIVSAFSFSVVALLALLLGSFHYDGTRPLVGMRSKLLLLGLAVSFVGGVFAYYGQFMKHCMNKAGRMKR